MAERSDLSEEVSAALDAAPVRHLGVADNRRERQMARRTEAVSLRLAGLNYEQIGERLDISEDGARDLVRRTLAQAHNRNVEEERALENARLDRVQAAIWAQVIQGDLYAIDRYLRISERRAKLNGLDAATKIDLSVTVRQEMEQALAELESIVLGEVVKERDDQSD